MKTNYISWDEHVNSELYRQVQLQCLHEDLVGKEVYFQRKGEDGARINVYRHNEGASPAGVYVPDEPFITEEIHTFNNLSDEKREELLKLDVLSSSPLAHWEASWTRHCVLLVGRLKGADIPVVIPTVLHNGSNYINTYGTLDYSLPHELKLRDNTYLGSKHKVSDYGLHLRRRSTEEQATLVNVYIDEKGNKKTRSIPIHRNEVEELRKIVTQWELAEMLIDDEFARASRAGEDSSS